MNKIKNLRVVRVDTESIEFENGYIIESEHEYDCCEHHYLDFSDLTLEDFTGLEFNLADSGFFRRVEDFGLELVPLLGWSVKVPGYGSNNGYYSHNLSLIIKDGDEVIRSYDIAECQSIDE